MAGEAATAEAIENHHRPRQASLDVASVSIAPKLVTTVQEIQTGDDIPSVVALATIERVVVWPKDDADWGVGWRVTADGRQSTQFRSHDEAVKVAHAAAALVMKKFEAESAVLTVTAELMNVLAGSAP